MEYDEDENVWKSGLKWMKENELQLSLIGKILIFKI